MSLEFIALQDAIGFSRTDRNCRRPPARQHCGCVEVVHMPQSHRVQQLRHFQRVNQHLFLSTHPPANKS
jgi:hypothetical protein